MYSRVPPAVGARAGGQPAVPRLSASMGEEETGKDAVYQMHPSMLPKAVQHAPGERECGHEEAQHEDQCRGADAHVRLAECGEHVCGGSGGGGRVWQRTVRRRDEAGERACSWLGGKGGLHREQSCNQPPAQSGLRRSPRCRCLPVRHSQLADWCSGATASRAIMKAKVPTTCQITEMPAAMPNAVQKGWQGRAVSSQRSAAGPLAA